MELNLPHYTGGRDGATLSLADVDVKSTASAAFKIKGIYFHDGFTYEPNFHAPLHWKEMQWRREIEWLKACGLNAVEFATMLEFCRIPSTEMERRKVEDRLKILELIHSNEMKFGYLLTNTVVSTVPKNEEPGHQLQNRAVELCAQMPGNFEKTITILEWYLRTYKEADFFEEFAADWGGCRCGVCGIPDFLRYVRVLAEKLNELNPSAELYANTWCISYWGKDPLAEGWKTMYEREVSGSREVIKALPDMPDNTHLALPCHHLYRPLTFTSYDSKGNTPTFPTQEDIINVHRAGRKVLAWPHFVMDDDAYRPLSWGIVHSEIRYIQQLLRTLRLMGIDSVIGNLYLPLLQISNTYAYGRLLDNPDADPIDLIRDFAKLVVVKDDVDKLVEVMVWVENNSYWEEQMPEDSRLPKLPVTVSTQRARKLAGEIRPNAKPAMPLPVSSQQWLEDLQISIEKMS